MQYPNARILIFAKAPIAGQVKTRLIPALGAQAATLLYQTLLVRVVAQLAAAELCPIECWCAPDATHPFFTQLKSDYGVMLCQQREGDLGARMHHASDASLSKAKSVVLIGGDCPVLEVSHLAYALGEMERGKAAVLGPAEDGGYVLLGLRQSSAHLFEDMPWGTDEVLAKTRSKLKYLQLEWAELPLLWDVDRPEDVLRLNGLSGFSNNV